jgi:hypothetical protein
MYLPRVPFETSETLSGVSIEECLEKMTNPRKTVFDSEPIIKPGKPGMYLGFDQDGNPAWIEEKN